MSFILGLDVGTAAGAAATKRDGTIQPCGLGERGWTLPSVVLLNDDGTYLTGEEAERVAGLELVRVARDLRRDPMVQADPIIVGGQVSTPYSMLRVLYTSAVERVCRLYNEVPTHVVVTHPALPEGLRCDMVERIADELFPGALLVPEPVAATVKFACDCALPTEGNVAVYDLGGGTLDLALVRRDGDRFTVLGEPTGLPDFGGIDIDDMVLSHVDASLDGAITELDLADPVALATLERLRMDCRTAKERLSYDDEVSIEASLPDDPALVTMRRHDLEELLFPRLEASLDVLEEMISDAGLTVPDIDAIVLIGGSANIPLVDELIQARTHIPVVLDNRPELTAAVGAAQMVDESSGSASVFPIAGLALPELAPAGAGSGTTLSSGLEKSVTSPGASWTPSLRGAYSEPESAANHRYRDLDSSPDTDVSPELAHGSNFETEQAALFGRGANPRARGVLLAGMVVMLLVAGAFLGLYSNGDDTAGAEDQIQSPLLPDGRAPSYRIPDDDEEGADEEDDEDDGHDVHDDGGARQADHDHRPRTETTADTTGSTGTIGSSLGQRGSGTNPPRSSAPSTTAPGTSNPTTTATSTTKPSTTTSTSTSTTTTSKPTTTTTTEPDD